jgi:hypothetical protein
VTEALTIALSPDVVEAIAQRAAEIVLEQLANGSPWMTRRQAARYLSVPKADSRRTSDFPATVGRAACSTTATSWTPTCPASLTRLPGTV